VTAVANGSRVTAECVHDEPEVKPEVKPKGKMSALKSPLTGVCEFEQKREVFCMIQN
jgi:hypothetical protein